MRKFVCTMCGHVYDPEVGDPDSGIAAGTAFRKIGPAPYAALVKRILNRKNSLDGYTRRFK